MSTTEGHHQSSIRYITHNGIEPLLWHQWKLSPNLLMTSASRYERSHPEVSEHADMQALLERRMCWTTNYSKGPDNDVDYSSLE
jgi:hypothetical protein